MSGLPSQLTDPEWERLLAENEGGDPQQVALRLRQSHPQWAAAVATQLSLRPRGAHKLPSWAAAGALWHREALEQATSEAAAQLKWAQVAPDLTLGRLAIDLCAGLGVDAWQLAQRFERVVALEADPERARLLRHNLSRLGVKNVAVIEALAEAWLAHYSGPPFELAYADPARRSARAPKAVAAHDLSPDPLELTRLLTGKAARLRLKLSPLFDLSEAWRLWPQAERVSVLSLSGEVKEVDVEMQLSGEAAHQTTPPRVRAYGPDFSVEVGLAQWRGRPGLPLREAGAVVLLPDAALSKAGLDALWLAQHAPSAGRLGTGGFWTADAAPEGWPGRVLSVESVVPYKPEALRKQLRAEGLTHAVVIARGVEESTAQVRTRLGLAEGDEPYLLICRSQSGRVCLRCRRFRRPL